MLQTSPQFKKKLLSVAFATLFLVACDSGSNDPVATAAAAEPDAHGDTHDQHDSKGRLAIAEQDQTLVRLIDLDDNSLLEEISTTNPASHLYASPSGRYLTVVQREQHLVEFIDGGLWQKLHDDHYDTIEQAPSLHSYQIDATQPTHYNTIADQAALYIDGDKVAGVSSGFYVLDDASIEAGKYVASHTLNTSMHGTLQIRGDYVLSTMVTDFTDQNENYNMPDRVTLFELHGDHLHEEQTFDVACPGLHGSFQGENWTLFGCRDGVLAIEQVGATFTAKKLPHDMGIGSIKGNNHLDKFLGLTRSQQAFLIDPVVGSMTEINWKVSPEITMLATATDGHQENFLVLDSEGYLNLFNIENDYALAHRFKVIEMPASTDEEVKAASTAIKHKIAVSSALEQVFISNPADNTILQVDLETQSVIATIQLDFTPSLITWLGIKAEANHAH